MCPRNGSTLGATGDHVVISAQQLLFRSGGAKGGGRSVGEKEVEPEEKEEDPAEDQGENDLGAENLAPHRGPVESLEPQVVGIEAGNALERCAKNDDQHHGDDSNNAPSTAEPARLTAGKVISSAHRHDTIGRSASVGVDPADQSAWAAVSQHVQAG